MSHKHKRRIEDEKHSSRANVFERLGDSKKERPSWQVHMSDKSSKPQRSNSSQYEGGRSSRINERWSSNQDQVMQPLPSKVKPKRSEYVDGYKDGYKQDRQRFDEDVHPSKHYRSTEKIIHKRLASPGELAREEYEARRKKRPRSPVLSPSRSISPLRLKPDAKKTKYQSPSPPPALYAKNKEQKRGRSKERKSKKMSEVVEEPIKRVKSNKAYQSYAESPDYKATLDEQRRYKKVRNADVYETSKYRDEAPVDSYKQKKHAVEPSLSKKNRDLEYRETESELSGVGGGARRYREESTKAAPHRVKAVRDDQVCLSDAASTASTRKKSKVKVEPQVMADPKRKKKARTEKEEYETQYVSKSTTADYASRDKPRKTRNDDYADVPKRREAKMNDYVDAIASEEEKKLKKKKKQTILEEATEQEKRGRAKQRIEVSQVKKKASKVQEAIQEKSKKVDSKKRKRARDSTPPSPSSSSQSSSSSSSSDSDSESEGEIRSKKNSRSARGSWETPNSANLSPARSYKKQRPPYQPKKAPMSPEAKEPRMKRPKVELTRRESPESGSSRSGSRYQRSPLRQQYKRQDRAYESQSYPSHDVAKEKRMQEEDARAGRRLHPAEVPQKRIERRMDYIDSKEERGAGKYEQLRRDEPLYNKQTGTAGKKQFPDRKEYYRYEEKGSEAAYDEKRTYARRESDFHDKKMHYDDRVADRNDHYPVDDRKHRTGYPVHNSRPQQQQQQRHKQGAYSHEQRPSDVRSMKDARHSDWQLERLKKQKEPAPGYSGGMQRISSWVDGREGSKLRIETRDSQSYRNGGREHVVRVDDRNYRPRAEARDPRPEVRDHRPEVRDHRPEVRDHRPEVRDSRPEVRDPRPEVRDPRPEVRDPRPEVRNPRPEVIELRSGRSDAREHHGARPLVRKPIHDKWSRERVQYEGGEVRREGSRYSDDRARSQDNLRLSEERASPAFYRKVRRSGGEARHRDLGIEITIHDDGGRSTTDYEKMRNAKSLRKVSSYEMSRSHDRALGKAQNDRNIPPSRDRGSAEVARFKLAPVSRDKGGMTKYQHQGREIPSLLDRQEERDYVRRREDAKRRDELKVRKKADKYFNAKSASGGGTEGERPRDNATLDRVRSRDSSATGRTRSRDSSRDKVPRGTGDRSRGRKDARTEKRRPSAERKPSKSTSKVASKDKGVSKDRSEQRKKSSKLKQSEKKQPQEKQSQPEDKEKKTPEAADVLDVDWTGISSNEKKPTTSQPGSILNRFTPGSILARMGVSTKLLPPEVVAEVRKKCADDTRTDSEPLILNRALGALNRAESLRRSSWLNAFKSDLSRLTSFEDAAHRQKILEIDWDLRFPPQPPMIINAKTYASSIKHYISKSKISVG